jgi:hypothetical protein
LRGKDIKRFGYDFADKWLINTHNGVKEKGIKPINIDNYPSVKKHLDSHWDKIKPRVDQGDTPYNLRNCAYMEDFYKQKIVWGEISDKAKFFLDSQDNYHVNNKCYMLTGNNLRFLTCYLNSTISEYLFSKIATTTGVGTTQWSKFTIEQLFVPNIESNERIWENMLCRLSKGEITEAHINHRIYDLCGLSHEEVEFIENYSEKL